MYQPINSQHFSSLGLTKSSMVMVDIRFRIRFRRHTCKENFMVGFDKLQTILTMDRCCGRASKEAPIGCMGLESLSLFLLTMELSLVGFTIELMWN